MELQMNWQHQSLQNLRPKTNPPIGLKNLGNTCYLNSVLQCLIFTPPLAQFCLSSNHSSICNSLFTNREKDCPFCVLERQIKRSLTLEAPIDAPSKIQKCITLLAEHFRWGRQEDAHEFLRYLIDACHNACLKLIKRLAGDSGPSSVMREIFGGALLSQVKCLSCEGESNKTDEIMDISLDLLQINSLKDALSRYFQPEVLDGSNKYSCEKCKKLSRAKKQLFMLRSPNVLVIQLKRFEGVLGGKISKNIEFEEALVLSKFTYNASQDSQPEYNLFGSIVHSGYSPDSGHYYAYIKDAFGRWYCCNDAHVSLSSTQQVLSEKVYILFYLRNNQVPRPSKAGSPCKSLKLDSNGSGISPCQKSCELLRQPCVKSNGGVPSKTNASTLLKNGRISPNPQIKAINLKRIVANGKSNLEVQNNATIENCSNFGQSKEKEMLTESKSVNGCKMVDILKVSSAPERIATADKVEQNIKQKSPLPNGIVCNNLLKAEAEKNNGIMNQSSNHMKMYESGNADSKRKSCYDERAEDQDLGMKESCCLCAKGDSCLKCRHHTEHSPELEKIKEDLYREASLNLRSNGWVDKVHKFMHTRKRLCTQATGRLGSCPDKDELRVQMKNESKNIFTTQIPESLKASLIGQLTKFYQGKLIWNS